MSNENTPYIERNPGDLISAEDWNCLQSKVKEDIENQVKEGIDSVKNVDKAADADKLEGKTAAEFGTIVVKENIGNDNKLKALTVMYKVEGFNQEYEKRYIHRIVELMEIYEKPVIGVSLVATKETVRSVSGRRYSGVFYQSPESAVNVLASMVSYQQYIAQF